jgi:hypothetical protein
MAIFNDLLNKVLGGSAGTGNLADDFHQVAQNVPPDVLSKGLSAAFNSSQTPDVGQMVSQMFGASSPEQRAGMLNQLSAALGPAATSVLGGLLGQSAVAGAAPTVTPDQASQVSPQQVQAAVTQAQQQNPGIVDSLSGFYAQHPGLVKTLGGAALAVAMAKISEHMKSA